MESEVIMGTKKGQVRKTARRAYEPKKKERKITKEEKVIFQNIDYTRKGWIYTGKTKPTRSYANPNLFRWRKDSRGWFMRRKS